MNWHYNENRHHEEDTLDLDTGEVTSSDGYKKKDTTYRKVFELFGSKYPLNWRKNTTEINAAKNILEEHGLDKARIALAFHNKFHGETYCPQILKPSDLDRKWQDLQAYRDRV